MTAKARVVDVVTVLTGVAAMAVAGKVLLTRPAAGPPAEEVREIPDWIDLAASGRRMGPPDAALQILEWGDYECPGCRGFHLHVGALQRKYPDDVALIFRHFPLSYHASAYPAARAAECAAAQGQFAAMHALLLEGERLDHATFMEYAQAADVPDIRAFERCARDLDPVERIESDIAAARAIRARGTPTVVVNGVLHAPPPDSSALEHMLVEITSKTRDSGGQ